MQLKELHTIFLNELKPLYDSHEASVITSMVFESVAHADKTALITQPGRQVEDEIVKNLKIALAKLKLHVPVQYVLGQAWFYKFIFKVSPAVLVPRPETEELVREALADIKQNNKKTVLDIGTGSGCIPISIKKDLPGCTVSAIDISEEALMIARENGEIHHTMIDWIQMNFLEEARWNELGQYDVIISNPPYIPENEKARLDKNVAAHEPLQALFVPDNQPLIFYEKIAAFGKKHLRKDGKIFMETHEDYARQVAALFVNVRYNALVKQDFYEKDRMVIATRSR
jgi:release factor glutamine methyltransferase